MPSLIKAAFIEPTSEAFVWYCSACNKVFALVRIPPSKPLVSELKKVNADFQLHCTRDHSGQPVVELKLRHRKKTPAKRLLGSSKKLPRTSRQLFLHLEMA